MNHSQSHTLEQSAADKMAYLTAVSYDLLYNPLSCKTFYTRFIEGFLPPYPLCSTFRDTRRADVKLSFTVRSFTSNSLIVTAMSLARASFRLANTRLLPIRILSYFRRKKFYHMHGDT